MSRRLEHAAGLGRGFTLMEVTLALGVASLLMLAMGGALMVSTSALDTASDSGSKSLQATGAASMLGAELAVAQDICELSEERICFTVPDRDGDGYAEEIEYTWGGAGRPLLRSYQGGSPVPVVQSVQALGVSSAEREPAVEVEGGERTLMSCESPAGSTTQSSLVTETSFQAQYVRPSMPAGAVSWKITRVKVNVTKASGNSKAMRVSIRTADASLKPTSTVLASTAFTSGSAPSSAGWLEFAIGPVAGLSPSQGVCIVIDSPTDGGDCYVNRAANGSNLPFNTHFMTGDKNGVWSAPNDTQDMKFILQGTITTLVEP